MNIKMYGIESKKEYHGTLYRFYSKFNAARGAWLYDKDSAISEGKEHEEIVRLLFIDSKGHHSAQQPNTETKASVS